VANRFYLGSYGLVLLWIDPQNISSEIRWEASDGEFFPHIYGPIDLEAVIAVTDFIPADDGRFYELQMPD
jgi:uncharacterized protein (DUF952 family)